MNVLSNLAYITYAASGLLYDWNIVLKRISLARAPQERLPPGHYLPWPELKSMNRLRTLLSLQGPNVSVQGDWSDSI